MILGRTCSCLSLVYNIIQSVWKERNYIRAETPSCHVSNKPVEFLMAASIMTITANLVEIRPLQDPHVNIEFEGKGQVY